MLAVATTLALGVAELAVRWLAPQQTILLRPDIWIPDDGLGWRMASSIDTVVNTGEGPVRLVTDDRGFRIVPTPAAPTPGSPGPLRILVLGDSFLAALQVEAEEILTARLAAALEHRLARPVMIDNTAVGGYGPSHYRILAQRRLTPGTYDLALVFLFLGNDVESRRVDHFPPKQAEIRHAFRLPRSLSRGELVRSILYPINDTLESRSHLFLAFRTQAWRLLMRLGLSARAFPQADLVGEADAPRWSITGALAEGIADHARKAGTPVLFVLLPGIYHVDPEVGAAYAAAVGLGPQEFDLAQSSRLLNRELGARGLTVIDTTPDLQRRLAAGVATHGRVDTHLSAAGHRAVAEAILPRVETLVAPREPP